MSRGVKHRAARLYLARRVPKWIRVYDNGGGDEWFCRGCCRFTSEMQLGPDSSGPSLCRCGHRLLRVPDGWGSFDRYTVIYTGRYPGKPRGVCHGVGMSKHPFHPQGFGQHFEYDFMVDCGRNSGFPPRVGDVAPFKARRIPFEVLPPDCQRLVRDDYAALWGLEKPGKT